MDCSIAIGSQSKKRNYEELEELGQKRANTFDLESVFRSEGKTKKGILPTLDLNAKLKLSASDYASSCIEDTSKQFEINFVKSRNLGLDLNSEDTSSSINHDPFHFYQNYNYLKAQDAFSECGSTCGDQRDSMKVWKEMKQNGFVLSSHGGLPLPPMAKPRANKKRNDSMLKKNIEIAKKEQADKFAKVAAPSGLLNELNPGIINHVRNRKQVHSIIENLVRSSRNENNNGGIKKQSMFQSHEFEGDDDLGMKNEDEDDILTLKLSTATTMASGNMSSLTNEESATISIVDSLSVKAACVASQWLQLLHQDIQGRLAALRRSKKRVRAVIQKEVPLLISNQENNLYAARSYGNGGSEKVNVDLHKVKWSALFGQMDNALSEEEKTLESSLNQVREMMLHCQHGLLHDYRIPKIETCPEKDLAVRAAAAAIYSTSNFLQSTENLPCF